MERKLAEFRARRKVEMAVEKCEHAERQNQNQTDNTFQSDRCDSVIADDKAEIDLSEYPKASPVSQKPHDMAVCIHWSMLNHLL